ncbi:hypothetical protein BJV78DRAFT_1259280 [Lactifluus subvellereus]|nr:hypothetical protein BJV78DRAFT_1259280 [Lactifluus subvellereus]
MNGITNCAERTFLFLANHTPRNYVLSMAVNRATGKPVGPRGIIHCLVAALRVGDAYNGLIPPSSATADASPRNHGTMPWQIITTTSGLTLNSCG